MRVRLILYVIYLLSVLPPAILVFIGKKHKTVFYVLFYITLTIIIATPIVLNIAKLEVDDSIKMGSFFYSAALSIICVYFGHIIRVLREYKDIEEKMGVQMEVFNNHPVLKSKESMDAVISSMFNLSESREIVGEFYSEALRDIKTKGAVRIEASFTAYTELLGKLMKGAKRVRGTFTQTPQTLRERFEKTDDQDSIFKEYLKQLNQYRRKIDRICVFEEDEIRSIKEDDIDWFNENIPSDKTKWTKTSTFFQILEQLNYHLREVIPSASTRMVDFAVFDNILLRWSSSDDKDDFGTIVMVIGEDVIKLSNALERFIDRYGCDEFSALLEQVKDKPTCN